MAGLGTRFLPATKSVPKEMLPVVDKPLIQYAVEEAVEAGIDTIILVTRGNKQAIVDHFKPSDELEAFLEARDKPAILRMVQGILPSGVTLIEAIQEQPLGLGHAILCARSQVQGEPFAVILPDDMVRAPAKGCLAQMMETYIQSSSNIIGVEQIPLEMSHQYGMAAVEQDHRGFQRITRLVEKPPVEQAPSDLGVVGRYILNNEIFDYLEILGKGSGGEIQLTDGIVGLMAEQEVLAFRFQGTRYDCGNRLGFIKAMIDYALEDESLSEPLRAHLASRVD